YLINTNFTHVPKGGTFLPKVVLLRILQEAMNNTCILLDLQHNFIQRQTKYHGFQTLLLPLTSSTHLHNANMRNENEACIILIL
ncbi:hypothetical protein ACJX0J_036837, partial [Zea mays]